MNHPEWVLQRVLVFLNRARSAGQILNAPELKDDPESGSGSGYVIGEKVAQQIITHRQTLPRRRYQSQADILSVPGLGEDKLNDLMHSFATSADDAFQQALFNGIILENWELHPVSRSYRSVAELRAVADGLDRFRLVVGELRAEQNSRLDTLGRKELILRYRQAYVASHSEAHLGSFPFAYWWYQFDQDNWFSFETIRLACERYLSHHDFTPEGMQLRMVQLYNQTAANEITRAEMVPVLVNYAEAKITVWDAQLND